MVNKIEVPDGLWASNPKQVDTITKTYWYGLAVGDILYYGDRTAVVCDVRAHKDGGFQYVPYNGSRYLQCIFDIDIELPTGQTAAISTTGDHGWQRRPPTPTRCEYSGDMPTANLAYFLGMVVSPVVILVGVGVFLAYVF